MEIIESVIAGIFLALLYPHIEGFKTIFKNFGKKEKIKTWLKEIIVKDGEIWRDIQRSLTNKETPSGVRVSDECIKIRVSEHIKKLKLNIKLKNSKIIATQNDNVIIKLLNQPLFEFICEEILGENKK